ncbi:MAG: hypothetical protein ACTHK4_03815 [Mycobacteriales bacterium]
MKGHAPWHHAALGAVLLVAGMVALGLVLEHTVGAGSGGVRPRDLAELSRHIHVGSRRISPELRAQLLKGPRIGGRFGGLDLRNTRGLARAVCEQVLIATAVVVLMLAWRWGRAQLRKR